MSEWKEYKLGELLEIKYGKDHKHLADGEFPLYGSGGIMRYVEKPIYESETILIPRKGTLTNLFYVDQPFWAVDTIFWSKIDASKSLGKFLYYVLKTHDLASLNVGSAVPSLTTEVLNDFRISIPEISVQKNIVGVLSSLDYKIDLLHRQNKTIEELAETLFRQWFVEEVNENWEEKGLDEIADFLNGLACQKFPIKANELGLPVIKIKELRTGITDASDMATNDVPEKYLVNEGDILFSWSGSLALVLWAGEQGVLNQHLFKVTSSEFPQWFCYFWIKYHLPYFIGVAEDKATTMGHIQRHHLSSALVVVPPKLKLDEYHQTIEPLFSKLKSNSRQIQTLRQLRDDLLPKLMSGEIKVN